MFKKGDRVRLIGGLVHKIVRAVGVNGHGQQLVWFEDDEQSHIAAHYVKEEEVFKPGDLVQFKTGVADAQGNRRIYEVSKTNDHGVYLKGAHVAYSPELFELYISPPVGSTEDEAAQDMPEPPEAPENGSEAPENHCTEDVCRGTCVPKCAEVRNTPQEACQCGKKERCYEYPHCDGYIPLSQREDREELIELRDAVQDYNAVSRPQHYQSGLGVEVIDIIREWFPDNYNLGNVLKYLLRADKKGNRQQDLEKALQYLSWEVERGR